MTFCGEYSSYEAKTVEAAIRMNPDCSAVPKTKFTSFRIRLKFF